MLCACSTHFRSDEGGGAVAPHQNVARVLSAKLRDGELKLLQGSIREAEATLRDALSLNKEEAQALLGRLEYDRGNYEKALQNLEEIQANTFIPSLRFFVADTKAGKKKGRHFKDGKDDVLDSFLHGASLLLEALYLKVKCLQELGRHSDAVRECKLMLDSMESAIPAGLPEEWGKTKVADMLSNSVRLLPEILLEMGRVSDAMFAYRRSLLRFSWCLSAPDLVHVMKSFAILLLYGGVEAPRASLGPSHVEGAFTPKDNTEEGILLLMILLRIMNKKQGYFDSSVFEHLSFALSTCGQLQILAHQYEALLPGTLSRPERWYSLALCYAGVGENTTALELLRKSLAQTEKPKDVLSLLLAAKLCACKTDLCSEGVQYTRRALSHLQRGNSGYRARALHVQGVALRSQRQGSLLDVLETKLQNEALESLQEAASLDKGDTSIIFDLGLEYAEQMRISSGLNCVKYCFDRGWGAGVHGWRFLALVLCAQEKHAEADAVLKSALEDTDVWEQGPLLRTRAKVQLALGKPLLAVQSYQLLLALFQVEQKELEPGVMVKAKVGQRVEEVEVWHDLAQVYTQLKQWGDAETCLEKARVLESYSAATWHITGMLREEQGQLEEAIVCYQNALAVDTSWVNSKVKLGALLWQVNGASAIPMSKTYLANALEDEPHHQEAWYHMGMLHKAEGRRLEAAASFQAALEQSSPLEKFTSITPALFW
ncbi:hypothetical protein M758_6G043200 [Ceratodon purpureus]|nr:hypothetical protein M758_6G043200 [Ceratodon purpureus]KAG0612640.1 hypothetical protein M758_6G043200 [Ceratodon purpureus]KAG0612641.1 hypothetical protein M758_6G043200 [Ceratodon purpureus]KAG0612645.1 hypothetical protein M758_6G043200 [Ceratodon purpureus]